MLLFVNKKINTRLFEKNDGIYINPDKGTVVDDTIVMLTDEKIFEFYMISNKNP